MISDGMKFLFALNECCNQTPIGKFRIFCTGCLYHGFKISPIEKIHLPISKILKSGAEMEHSAP